MASPARPCRRALAGRQDPCRLSRRQGLQDPWDPVDLRDPARLAVQQGQQAPSDRPLPGHPSALARLEVELAARGGELFLCTQNVDDLHEKAGSRRVVHMHGELAVTRCDHCQALKPDMAPLTAEAVCEACGRDGGARPHVVWFGEKSLRSYSVKS